MLDNEAPIKPDYRGGSIVNLMASIMQAFGAASKIYPPLRGLPATTFATRNVVLLVIDGLGHDNLLELCGDGVLARHLRERITSVFPSTTATAVTTFLCGNAPQQHGITGWFTYFRELGTILAVLPYRPRHGGSAPAVSARTLFDHTPVFDLLDARCHMVVPNHIVSSDFNAAHLGAARPHGYVGLAGMLDTIVQIVREPGERQYVYAYWPELDRLGHERGIGSHEATAHLATIDAAFGAFLDRIEGTDTTVIVTADHGLIDSRPDRMIDIGQHPELARTLLLPLCGERRAAYCYVRARRRAEFVDYVKARFEEHADAMESEYLIDSGYFGLGAAHARLQERVGDYTLLMKHNALVKDWVLGEQRYAHVSVHGGVSAHEVYVPLIVAQV
jgi:hypothetical protein